MAESYNKVSFTVRVWLSKPPSLRPYPAVLWKNTLD